VGQRLLLHHRPDHVGDRAGVHAHALVSRGYLDMSTIAMRLVRRRGFRMFWREIVLYTVSLILALWIILPFSWIVISSFMHEVDAIVILPEFISSCFILDNYLAFFLPEKLEANRFIG